MEDEKTSKFSFVTPQSFLFFLLLVIIGNLLIIDSVLFFSRESKSQENQTVSPPKVNTTLTPTPHSGCSDECKAEISKAVSSLIPIQQKVQQTQSSSKEYFVPLGSGSSTSEVWADVAGAQSYVDGSAYGLIKNVTFEASLYTPTNNQFAQARLYNITDNHPVWNSEVRIDGGNPQLKISSPITLEKGSKLYQVQMLTQLGSRTNLEYARIRITTQ